MSNRGKWKRDKNRFDKNRNISFSCNSEMADAIAEYSLSREVSMSNAIRNLIDIGLQGKVDFRVRDIEAMRLIERGSCPLSTKDEMIGYAVFKNEFTDEEWAKIESVLNRIKVNR